MQRLSLLLAPTKLVPLSDRMTITIKFFNIFLYFSEKPHQIIIISRKKVVIETNIWSTQDTSLPKFANIHIYNAIIQKLVNISFFVCLFFFFVEKAYLVLMIYIQKLVHITKSWGECSKNLPKTC